MLTTTVTSAQVRLLKVLQLTFCNTYCTSAVDLISSSDRNEC